MTVLLAVKTVLNALQRGAIYVNMDFTFKIPLIIVVLAVIIA